MFRSPRRWALTADRLRAVPDTHPEAAYLLVGQGCEIELELAERYGLLEAEQPKRKRGKREHRSD